MEIITIYAELELTIQFIEDDTRTAEQAIRENDPEKALAILKQFYKRTNESRHLARSLFEEATVDEVTGLKNRKYYAERLRRFADESDLACLLTDIDHFKKYNDSYGHPQGDIALRTIATVIKGYGDPENVFRYGGEEYILFVVRKKCTTDELYHLGEQVRQAVEKAVIPSIENQATAIEEAYPRGIHHVTISIGGATRQQDEPLDYIIRRADQTLYEAKKTRNTVKISR